MLEISMYFRREGGLTFKVTVEEYENPIPIAQAIWDRNVKLGFEPVSARP